MPVFLYKAKQKDSQTVTGEVVAQGKDEAIEKIHQMELLPIKVDEKDAVKGRSQVHSGKVKAKELYSFSRQLSGLLKAGIPLIRALQIIQDQISNLYFRQVVIDLCHKVNEGRAFSDALSDFPNVFSPLYVAMVHAGEESGNLKEMLMNMANYHKQQAEIASRIRTAMAYPLIMLCLGIGTIVFMLTYVMPKIINLFSDFESLPLATQILINLSEFLKVGWFAIIVGLAAVVLLIRGWLSTPKGHQTWSQWQLGIPVYNRFVLRIEIARFCQTLDLLLRSGITILKALSLSIPLVKNDLLREHFERCREDLAAGDSFGESLKKSKLIPSVLGDLIAVGEESGSLSDSLQDIADSYREETDEALKILTTLLEPLMIIVVGAAIAFIVFAILLPIFQMDVFR